METFPMAEDEAANVAAREATSPTTTSGPKGHEDLATDSPSTKRAKFQKAIPISDESMVAPTEIDQTPAGNRDGRDEPSADNDQPSAGGEARDEFGDEPVGGSDATEYYEAESDGEKQQSVPPSAPSAEEAPSKVLGMSLSSKYFIPCINSFGFDGLYTLRNPT